VCIFEHVQWRWALNGTPAPGSLAALQVECDTAMDISALSFYSNEKESLLAPVPYHFTVF
jgi:hypothetical protein